MTGDGKAPRILLTGADGFVGRHLVPILRAMLPADGSVFAFGRSGQGPAGTQPLTGSITDAAAVTRAVIAARPTAVLHLAAIASPAQAKAAPRQAWEVNLTGTLNLAEAVRQEAPEALFCHVSTSETYGDSFKGSQSPLPESATLAPRSVYGATKAASDILVRQLSADGLRTVVFRPFNHTGAGQNKDYVVPGFAAQIAGIERGEGPPVIEVGNLDAERDFLDVADVVRAYALCLSGRAAPRSGAAYNLCSGAARRIGDVLHGLVALSRVKVDIRVRPDLLRANDIPRTWGDNSAARTDLGWSPQIPFEQTLQAVLDDKRLATDKR